MEIAKRQLEQEHAQKTVLMMKNRTKDIVFRVLAVVFILIPFVLVSRSSPWSGYAFYALFFQPVVLIYVLYRFFSKSVFLYLHDQKNQLYTYRLTGLAAGLIIGILFTFLVPVLQPDLRGADVDLFGLSIPIILASLGIIVPNTTYLTLDCADFIYLKTHRGKLVPDYQ